jgi:5'(3')-deoxyribonucleotidase
MNDRPILLDLDETIYPFVHTWEKWLTMNKGEPINWEALGQKYDLDTHMPTHIEHAAAFLKEHHLVEPTPLVEAFRVISFASNHFPIVACTARNEQDWKNATSEWVEKHLPFVNGILHTRTHRGSSAILKGQVCTELNALALVDDSKEWIDTLPPETIGYLVKRPAPLASDPGAMEWHEVETHLKTVIEDFKK